MLTLSPQATSPLSLLSHSGFKKPTSHRALLARIPTKGQTPWQLADSHPIPPVGPDQVLIRTLYVGLNPFDWQAVEYRFGIGHEAKAMGRDGAGVVVEMGSAVKRFKVGDRVSNLNVAQFDGILIRRTPYRSGSVQTLVVPVPVHSKSIRYTPLPKSGILHRTYRTNKRLRSVLD
jgi:hypothetical protein